MLTRTWPAREIHPSLNVTCVGAEVYWRSHCREKVWRFWRFQQCPNPRKHPEAHCKHASSVMHAAHYHMYRRWSLLPSNAPRTQKNTLFRCTIRLDITCCLTAGQWGPHLIWNPTLASCYYKPKTLRMYVDRPGFLGMHITAQTSASPFWELSWNNRLVGTLWKNCAVPVSGEQMSKTGGLKRSVFTLTAQLFPKRGAKWAEKVRN